MFKIKMTKATYKIFAWLPSVKTKNNSTRVCGLNTLVCLAVNVMCFWVFWQLRYSVLERQLRTGRTDGQTDRSRQCVMRRLYWQDRNL